MFTKRHYEWMAKQFARNLNGQWPEGCERERQTVVDLAHQFADAAKADNDNFNRERFLQACGV